MTKNVRHTVEVEDVSSCHTVVELIAYADKLYGEYGDVGWQHSNRCEFTVVVLSREQTEEELRVEKAVERLTKELYMCVDINKHLDAVAEVGRDKYHQIIDKINSKR